MTVTASPDGATVQRQVLVFPNFNTQSQRYDLQIYQVGALDPAPLWEPLFADLGRGEARSVIGARLFELQPVEQARGVAPGSQPVARGRDERVVVALQPAPVRCQHRLEQAVRVLDAAGCDPVLVETVGVGQSEVES